MTTSDPGNLPDAPNLQLRAALIARIQMLASNDWTQQEAARICGQTQPRISDLRRGATERFSLDALVNIAAALARHTTTTEGDLMEYTEADGGLKRFDVEDGELMGYKAKLLDEPKRTKATTLPDRL
ncbi:Predicted DNA-binding protein, contains XRE-type HTH domain [Duganella sp. CF517]|uniref:helix-turn-helix domain-containing protein n=1 Tax=Duganella sp. CF517 TaxID=1881038 RepID=UPI0008B8407D|nr:XRE family transcriptional regulator [Duganella sp. CF517]SEN79841.1 Predicted DNA-binding protein, contains XRE-type HTH domain [Duganella sp. CF517]